MSSVEERRKERLLFMDALYNVVGGLEGDLADMTVLQNRLGLDLEKEEDFKTFQRTARYLRGEGLIGTIDVESGTVIIGVSLTHAGVREVEEARSKPDQPTEHFAPINIVYAETITNTSIQQGSPEATVNFSVVAEGDLLELRDLV